MASFEELGYNSKITTQQHNYNMAAISTSSRTFKLALIQLSVGINKTANLTRATEKIEEAAKNGAQVRFLYSTAGPPNCQFPYYEYKC